MDKQIGINSRMAVFQEGFVQIYHSRILIGSVDVHEVRENMSLMI